MLRRWASAASAVVVALVFVLGGAPSASAAGCSGDEETEECIHDGSGGVTLPTGATFEGSSGHTKRVCFDTAANTSVPCTDPAFGVWSQGLQCYLSPSPEDAGGPGVPPRPAGLDDNDLYFCVHDVGFAGSTFVWLPTPPQVPVDPLTLVYQGIIEMQLHAISIGIVPEPGANRKGLIGLPTWMWTADPGPSTLGPNSRTLSLNGTSATMTAHVVRTDWNMGNGHSVSCTGAGTPYQDRFGAQSSPTCGHKYTEPGSYQVTGTTHWVVDWTSSNGDAGQIRFYLVAGTTIRIGESQALVGS